jgi:hypothetical protein
LITVYLILTLLFFFIKKGSHPIVDQVGLVEIVNAEIGENSQEKISAGIVVKAMILNGLGFVNAPRSVEHRKKPNKIGYYR